MQVLWYSADEYLMIRNHFEAVVGVLMFDHFHHTACEVAEYIVAGPVVDMGDKLLFSADGFTFCIL
jgi:hypothetical protein